MAAPPLPRLPAPCFRACAAPLRRPPSALAVAPKGFAAVDAPSSRNGMKPGGRWSPQCSLGFGPRDKWAKLNRALGSMIWPGYAGTWEGPGLPCSSRSTMLLPSSSPRSHRDRMRVVACGSSASIASISTSLLACRMACTTGSSRAASAPGPGPAPARPWPSSSSGSSSACNIWLNGCKAACCSSCCCTWWAFRTMSGQMLCSSCWQVAGKCASRLAAAATSSCRMGSGTACSPCATRKAREACLLSSPKPSSGLRLVTDPAALLLGGSLTVLTLAASCASM
mmetsp:Transcript_17592/g.49068  ORF Transcript_17592/g.49068 Transcript_17592/m.49068 type:complete len:282 (-) Transcript_17592:9-854(-)